MRALTTLPSHSLWPVASSLPLGRHAVPRPLAHWAVAHSQRLVCVRAEQQPQKGDAVAAAAAAAGDAAAGAQANAPVVESLAAAAATTPASDAPLAAAAPAATPAVESAAGEPAPAQERSAAAAASSAPDVDVLALGKAVPYTPGGGKPAKGFFGRLLAMTDNLTQQQQTMALTGFLVLAFGELGCAIRGQLGCAIRGQAAGMRGAVLQLREQDGAELRCCAMAVCVWLGVHSKGSARKHGCALGCLAAVACSVSENGHVHKHARLMQLLCALSLMQLLCALSQLTLAWPSCLHHSDRALPAAHAVLRRHQQASSAHQCGHRRCCACSSVSLSSSHACMLGE